MRFICLLSLTVSGQSQGVDTQSGACFRQARRSGLWPAAEAVHRRAVTKARAKRSWTAVEHLHQDAVGLSQELGPPSDEDPWQGLSGFAIDGSISQRPAAKAVRQALDPDRGLDHPGQGPSPQWLVSPVDDGFRRLPIAGTVRPIAEANEREEVKALLPSIPSGGVLRFDRGDPSYDLIAYLNRHDSGSWLFRGPAPSTFPAVEAFVRSGQTEAMMTLQVAKAQTFPVRAIRLTRPAGTGSVLLTNRSDNARFSAEAIMALDVRRWGVETPYRDETTSRAIEPFHSQTAHGIRQELFARLIRAGIARLRMRLPPAPDPPARAQPQFKHAIITLAHEAYLLTPQGPKVAFMSFSDLLNEIARVRSYRPPIPRPSQPRVSQKPLNKGQIDQAKRMAEA